MLKPEQQQSFWVKNRLLQPPRQVAEYITESDLRITSKCDQIDATSVATKATTKLEFGSTNRQKLGANIS